MVMLVRALILSLCVSSVAYAFGEVEVLLSKEAKVESARTSLTAVKERNTRLISELVDLMNRKQDAEIENIEIKFGATADMISASARERRDEMNRQLQGFVLKYTDSPSVAQVYLRLAELYYNQAKEDFAKAYEVYDTEMLKFEENPETVSEPTPPEDLTFDKAIELYREFIQLFPTHPYLPEALYLLGFTYEENGDADEAAEVWQRLIALNPRGPLAPEARFRYGEYLFLEFELEDAEVQYTAVVDSGDETFSDKSLYKLGWTQYLMERYSDAVDTFVRLVDLQSRSGEEGEKLSMRKEALQYIAFSFSERGGLQGLEGLIKKLGGRSYDLELYEALGQVYYDLTQYEAAAETYREIIKQYPSNIRNPDIQEAIIQIAGNVEGIDSALAERKNFVTNFGPGSQWSRIYLRSNPQLVATVQSKAENFLYEYSTFFHADSQNPKKNKVQQAQQLARAVSAYEEFVATFPDSEKMQEALFNLAEIKYELKEWANAANLYRRMTQVLVDPNDEMFLESSWNMVLSYRNDLSEHEREHPVEEYLAGLTASTAASDVTGAVAAETEKRSVAAKTGGRADAASVDSSGDSRGRKKARTVEKKRVSNTKLETKTAGPSGDAQELPPAVVALVDGSEYYIQLFPLGERTPQLMYEVGTLMLKYHLWTLARTYFLRFVRRFPNDEFVLDAIKNAAKTYIEEGRFDELVKWGIEVLDSSLGERKPIYDYFAGILSGALFKDAGRLEEEKRYLDANKLYEELRTRYPESEYIDESIQNSAINYQLTARWDESNRLFRKFASDYPTTEFAPKALFQVAINFEKYMDYDSAITSYEEVIARYPKSEEAKDALYNAATLAAKLLYLEKAAELYLSYLSKYKGADDEEEILYFAADSYFQLQEYDQALAIYKRFFKKVKVSKPNRIVKSYYNIARIYEAQGAIKQMDEWDKKIVAYTLEHLEDAEKINSRYAAELAFKFAMNDYRAYEAVRLRGSLKKMGAALKEKIALLPKMNATFLDIIKYRDPLYASAALHMIGSTFMELANTLFDAPVPEELDEESQEIYLEELEDQAYPIEEKALQAWQKNLDNAVRLGIVNEWVMKSRKKLESISSNLQKIKRSENFMISSSEFFYEFGSADIKNDKYTILGARVIYPDLPEGSAAALQEKYTFANFFQDYHKNLLMELGRSEISFTFNGRALNFNAIGAVQ